MIRTWLLSLLALLSKHWFIDKRILFIIFCFARYDALNSYGLPPVNLGGTNFFDGFGLLERKEWSYQHLTTYYHSNFFADHEGNELPGIRNPHFNVVVTIPQVAYMSPNPIICDMKPGITVTLPIVLYSHINRNQLGIRSSGSGFGNLILAPFLQGPLRYKNDEPFYIHRFACIFAFPTGKNRAPLFNINPSVSFYYISPHWAATLFITPKLSVSWRLHYLWCGFDEKFCRKPGDAVHLNFASAYRIKPLKFYVGPSGYYLKQLTNNKVMGVEVPNTKEEVLGIGGGFLYIHKLKYMFFGHVYWEPIVKNRPKGIRAIVRFAITF